MLYIPESESHSRTLAKRVERGTLRRLARGVYSDDFERTAAEQVAEQVLAICGRLFPDGYVSHSSAALRAPVDGLLFLSQAARAGGPRELPGVKVVRLPALPYPEVERIEAPTLVVRTRDDEPEPVTVAVSSALQTVFECLMPARHYPQRQLPHAALFPLIEHLSTRDRERAAAFAERNGLHTEYRRLMELWGGRQVREAVYTHGLRRFELYFYRWHVGSLTALGNDEFRFEYTPGWGIPLSRELPVRENGQISYEGSRMPAFFENFLPEGWTESRLLRTYRLDPDDRVGLLGSTRKYLSNFTLRPLGIPEAEFHFDALDARLADIAPETTTVLHAEDSVQRDHETSRVWREFRERGALGLSGVQPKLPVSLTVESGVPIVMLGDLRNSCSHILKLASPHQEWFIENEWVTMELARRAGLPVAPVRLVQFGDDSLFHGRSLLIERYDVPGRADLERDATELELMLQEDACSLLLLTRREKYRPSLERVADALRDAGLPDAPATPGLWTLLRHVAFSWLVANGDLHAKNISALRMIRPGTLGASPAVTRVEYSPLYDLLNTRLVIPDDDFALPVNGRRNNIRVRDIADLATRWKGSRAEGEAVVMSVAAEVRAHLDGVLGSGHLPDALAESYRRVVDVRLREWGA